MKSPRNRHNDPLTTRSLESNLTLNSSHKNQQGFSFRQNEDKGEIHVYNAAPLAALPILRARFENSLFVFLFIFPFFFRLDLNQQPASSNPSRSRKTLLKQKLENQRKADDEFIKSRAQRTNHAEQSLLQMKVENLLSVQPTREVEQILESNSQQKYHTMASLNQEWNKLVHDPIVHRNKLKSLAHKEGGTRLLPKSEILSSSMYNSMAPLVLSEDPLRREKEERRTEVDTRRFIDAVLSPDFLTLKSAGLSLGSAPLPLPQTLQDEVDANEILFQQQQQLLDSTTAAGGVSSASLNSSYFNSHKTSLHHLLPHNSFFNSRDNNNINSKINFPHDRSTHSAPSRLLSLQIPSLTLFPPPPPPRSKQKSALAIKFSGPIAPPSSLCAPPPETRGHGSFAPLRKSPVFNYDQSLSYNSDISAAMQHANALDSAERPIWEPLESSPGCRPQLSPLAWSALYVKASPFSALRDGGSLTAGVRRGPYEFEEAEEEFAGTRTNGNKGILADNGRIALRGESSLYIDPITGSGCGAPVQDHRFYPRDNKVVWREMGGKRGRKRFSLMPGMGSKHPMIQEGLQIVGGAALGVGRLPFYSEDGVNFNKKDEINRIKAFYNGDDEQINRYHHDDDKLSVSSGIDFKKMERADHDERELTRDDLGNKKTLKKSFGTHLNGKSKHMDQFNPITHIV